jgi:hypothetical protein
MVHTFIKTDITVAALEIPSINCFKTITMNNNKGTAKLLSYSFNSLSFTQHVAYNQVNPKTKGPALEHQPQTEPEDTIIADKPQNSDTPGTPQKNPHSL